MLLYWAETVVIGLFNIPKLLTAGMGSQKGMSHGCGALFITVFFVIHYGGFNFGHYLFLSQLFDLPEIDRNLVIALAGLAASHGFSLLVNWFGKREYAGRDASEQMLAPYGRVVVMHIAVLFGGALSLAFGTTAPALVLLVALKTAVDLYAHSRSHRETKYF